MPFRKLVEIIILILMINSFGSIGLGAVKLVSSYGLVGQISDEGGIVWSWKSTADAVKFNVYINDKYVTTVSKAKTYVQRDPVVGDNKLYVVSIDKDERFSPRSKVANVTFKKEDPSQAGGGSSPPSEIEGLDLPICRFFVASSGSDSNSGEVKSPFKTVARAIKEASEGGTVCLSSGTYGSINIKNLKASANRPLVVRPNPGDEGEVILKGSNYRGFGVLVQKSSHVFIVGLRITKFQKAIGFMSVNTGGMYFNKAYDIGMEALHVGATFNYSTRKFDGGPSSYVDIVGNSVNGTGYLPLNGQSPNPYSEGIYVGTGSKGGDKTHHILVQENDINNTGAEGIEVKPFTHHVSVVRNKVTNVSLKYSGAITISVGNTYTENGYYRVTGNYIRNVNTRKYSISGIVVGHGNTIVKNNNVGNVEGGVGIRVIRAFNNKNARNVLIENNHLNGDRIGVNEGHGGFPNMDGVVTLKNNK